MKKYYMNAGAFPNPPTDPMVTTYVDCATGNSYYWDGAAYQPWQRDTTARNPAVFAGPKATNANPMHVRVVP